MGGPGGRLKWTQRFIAISFEVSEAIPAGHINVSPPTADIPAEHVWNGQARSANADGVILKDWEALFAAHRVGGDHAAVDLKIVSYSDYAAHTAARRANPFTAPSNWLLVAALNSENKTVRLGTGVTLAMHSSSTNGSPVPVGTIMMWSGSANNIPGGWALCDGENGTPNLQDRFVLGAGSAGAGQSGEADQHTHAYHIPPATFNTTPTGQHTHAFPGWYKRNMSSYVAVSQHEYTMIDSGGHEPRNQATAEAGHHTHQVTVNYNPFKTSENTGQNRPRRFALCFIMKL